MAKIKSEEKEYMKNRTKTGGGIMEPSQNDDDFDEEKKQLRELALIYIGLEAVEGKNNLYPLFIYIFNTNYIKYHDWSTYKRI